MVNINILFVLIVIFFDEKGNLNLSKHQVSAVTTGYQTVCEELDEQLQVAWGDVTGSELDPVKVKEARVEEVQYIHKSNLYTKVPRSKESKVKNPK